MKQNLMALRMLLDRLVTGHVLGVNPGILQRFGSDDINGTLVEERVYHGADATPPVRTCSAAS